MRIFVAFIFQYKKSNLNQEMTIYDAVLKYMNNNNLSYNNILYKFYDFVYKTQKWCKIDKFLKKYKELEIYKLSNGIMYEYGATNCEYKNWNPKDSIKVIQDEMKVICDEAINDYSFTVNVCFNQINWFANPKQHIVVNKENEKLIPTIYPLGSHITISKDYLKKQEIIICFELDSKHHDFQKHVNNAIEYLGVNYYEKIIYKYFEPSERELIKIGDDFAKQAVRAFEKKYSKIKLQNDRSHIKGTISVAKAIKLLCKGYELQYWGVENGCYILHKKDKFNNEIEVGLDYVDKCLGAYINYNGLEFSHHFNLNDATIKSQQDIENYIDFAFKIMKIAEVELFPVIVKHYKPTPEWLY